MVLLLLLLGTATGLGPAGWLTGLAFALVTWAMLTRALYSARGSARSGRPIASRWRGRHSSAV